MADSVELDARSQPESRRPSGGLPINVEEQKPRVASRFLKFLSRCIFGVGYTAVTIVVLVALLEFVSWIVCSIFPLTRQAQVEDQRASPVYEGAEWAPEFWRGETLRQQKLRTYVPFRLWGVPEWHSKYVNNDSTTLGFLRRTINPTNCASPHAVAVWTFGGSTMYGVGAPDGATLSSYLSRELNTGAENCVLVSNFGVEGYVTDQELILLQEQLKAGGHPDIVIFYDGLNDSMLQCPPGPATPHGGYGMIKSRIEGSPSGRLDFLQSSYALRLARELRARLHQQHAIASQASDMQPRIASVISKYEANIRLARALAGAYGFKLYSFWQPMLLYGHKPLVPFEERVARPDASSIPADYACLLMMAAVYREAERHAARDGNFVFLGDVFDSTKEATYIDQGHLGPRGNEVVASAIANYIRDHSGQKQSIQKN